MGGMTQIPDGQQGRPSGPDGAGNGVGLWTWLRGLKVRRRSEDRWFAGVCSGLADRLGVDPVLVRAVFILVLIFGGLGLPLYLLAWALLPDRHGEIAAENAIRHHDSKSIVLLVVVGIAVLGGLSDKWLLWLILAPVGILVFWALRSAKSGKSSDEIGREASQFATRIGDTVSGWVSSPGSTGGAPGTPQTRELREAREAREQAEAPGTSPATLPYAASAPVLPATPVTLDPVNPPFGGRDGPHGMGPGRTGSVTAPPPQIVRDRRRRGGFLGLLLVVGLAVAGYAGGTQLQSEFAWPTSTPVTFALACALGGAGLALVLVGLTGRRAGFLTFLATVLAIAAVTGTIGPVPGFVKGGLGDRTWRVSDRVPAGGYHLGAGQATLDLTGATPGQDITVTQGAGDLTIVVPTGVTATIDASVAAGNLALPKPGGTSSQEGVDSVDSVNRPFGTGATAITVTAHLGAGNLTIKVQ